MNPDHIILTESEKQSLFDNFDLDEQTSQSEHGNNEPEPIRQRILSCDYRPISEEEEFDEKDDNQENDFHYFSRPNFFKIQTPECRAEFTLKVSSICSIRIRARKGVKNLPNSH